MQEGAQAQYDAFYRLSNTEQQITSYVFDVSPPCSRSLLHAFGLSRCRCQSVGFIVCHFLGAKGRQAVLWQGSRSQSSAAGCARHCAQDNP